MSEGASPDTTLDPTEGTHVLTGTHVVAIKYKDGILMAADMGGGSEPRLVDAATKQLSTLPFYHSFWNHSTKPTLMEMQSGNSFNNLIPFAKNPYKDSDYGNEEVAESIKEEKRRKQMEAVVDDLFIVNNKLYILSMVNKTGGKAAQRH